MPNLRGRWIPGRLTSRLIPSTRAAIRWLVLRAILAAPMAATLLVPTEASAALTDSNNVCDQPGEAPDIIVGDIGGGMSSADVWRWGSINGITAYSFSATACNIGTCWAEWFFDGPHPVISQGIFVLKDGRFQQIGQSWIKHAAAAEPGTYCGECLPGNSTHLGVNCSDLYDWNFNGLQFLMGMRDSINPYAGTYSQNPVNQTGNAIYRRLQVHNFDLDPANNPAAKYFVEIMYVSQDDAAAHNAENNVSYRPIVVSGSAATGVYNIALGRTTEGSISARR